MKKLKESTKLAIGMFILTGLIIFLFITIANAKKYKYSYIEKRYVYNGLKWGNQWELNDSIYFVNVSKKPIAIDTTIGAYRFKNIIINLDSVSVKD